MSNFFKIVRKSLELYIETRWLFIFIFFLLGIYITSLSIGRSGYTIKTLFQVLYLFFPAFLIIIPSTLILSERNSHFTDIMLTNPISNSGYYFSRYLLSLIVGLIYIAFTIPFGIVAVVGNSLSTLFLEYLIASILIILFISGLSMLIGSIFVKPTSSVILCLVLAFLFVLMPLYQRIYIFLEGGNETLLTLMRISPILSVSDFMKFPTFSFDIFLTPIKVENGVPSLICLLVFIIIFPLVGFFIFEHIREGKKKILADLLVIFSIIAPPLLIPINLEFDTIEEIGLSTSSLSSCSLYSTTYITAVFILILIILLLPALLREKRRKKVGERRR